jgi:hypothetical protein
LEELESESNNLRESLRLISDSAKRDQLHMQGYEQQTKMMQDEIRYLKSTHEDNIRQSRDAPIYRF